MELKQQSIIDFKEPEDNRKRQKATPMMIQYLEVKDRHKEYLLFYRMGDFYELFFEDAKIAAKDLGIALTKRGKLEDKDIPMCGVPAHSSQTYLSRLINLGYKVAVAEHAVHVLKLADIPAPNWLVEFVVVAKHVSHIGHTRHVPACDVWVAVHIHD